MSFTASQLTTFYTNANMGITPSAAESLLIQAYAQQNANGALSDAQTLNNVLALSRDKTDVAVATYEFFTGATPTLAGLSYLVHGGGNANDLSSAYYANFNTENRYYNFAINLAFGGPNAAGFATTYGAMTFTQAVSAAYELIIGSANATAAGIDPAKAQASIASSLSFFQALAAQRAPSANQDLATKAIMIGYILEEAIKADVGTYAKGVDGFMSSLAQTGTAVTGDLLANYPATAGGQTLTLTTGVDNIVGTAGTDTVSGTIGAGAASTFTALDKIDLGAGADVLNIADVAGGTALPGGISVNNVETVNEASAGAATIDITSGFTGVTQLNVTQSTGNDVVKAGGATGVSVTDTLAAGTVNVTAGTGAVVVNAAGAVTVAGGSSQTVNTAGGVTLSGATGAITATDTAQGNAASSIIDGANVNLTTTTTGTGTVAIGSASHTPTGTVTVTENLKGTGALTGGAITVLGGTSDTVTVNASQKTANTTTTVGAISVTGSAVTTTVAVNQTAAVAPVAAVTAVAGVTETGSAAFAALTAGQTLTIAGLTFTAGAAGTTAAQTAAAFANLTAGATQGNSTLGTYTGQLAGWTSGALSTSTVVFTSTTANTNVADLSTTVGGTGTAPTITETQGVTAVAAVTGVGGIVDGAVTVADPNAGTATASTITTVTLNGYGAGSAVSSDALATLALANSAGGVTVNDKTATALGLTVNNLGAGATLNLDGAGAKYTSLSVTTTGADSKLNLTAAAVTSMAVAGSNAIDLTGSTLSALKTLTVSGSAGMTLAAPGTTTDINASGTSGAVTVTALDASKATYEGSTGVDTLTLGATTVSKAISLGGGNDSLTLASGTTAVTSTVDGGAGTDTLTMVAADAVTASASNVFASHVINFEVLGLTGGTGAQLVHVDVLGNYNAVVTGAEANAGVLTMDGFTSGGSLELSSSAVGTGAYVVSSAAFTTPTNDVFNVLVDKNVAAGSVTANKVETLNIVEKGSATSAESLTLVGDSDTAVNVSGTGNLTLTANNTTQTTVNASALAGGLTYTTAGTVAETVTGGSGANALTAHAGTTADVLVGGAGADVLTANGGLDILTGGGGNNTFKVQTPSANLNTYSTITDEHIGDTVVVKVQGVEVFNTTKVTLAPTAVFQDYANAVVAAGGDSSVNAHLGWFQFNGDTYIVESLHNGATTPSFVNGTDLVVKLTGLIDLSHTSLNTGAASLLIG